MRGATGLTTPDGTGPLYDGGPLDVQVECATPSYCTPTDPGFVYKCGQRIFQCSSLEQCEESGQDGGGAACVNPCLDSLGNDTSNGCEFYAVEMDTTQEVMGACYAVFVVNQWKTGEPAKIAVTLGGQALPIEQFARIPVGHGTGYVRAFDPDPRPADQRDRGPVPVARSGGDSGSDASDDPRVLASCPTGVVPRCRATLSLHGTGTATAFHIKTNVPVVAYQMLPYGGGRARVTAATLLLPTTAWDTNYVVADAYEAPLIPMIDEPRAGPTAVVDREPGPDARRLDPTTDILPGGSVGGSAAGVPVEYTLSHGQYLQITQSAELTGSAVQSDRPVAVLGASTLVDIPLDVVRADTAEQIRPGARARQRVRRGPLPQPLSPAPRSRPRGGSSAGPGTVAHLGVRPPPSGAPTTLSAGEVATFESPRPVRRVEPGLQHPFYVASHMTGAEQFDPGYTADGGMTNRRGMGEATGIRQRHPARRVHLVLHVLHRSDLSRDQSGGRRRPTGASGGADVTLDCAGLLPAGSLWHRPGSTSLPASIWSRATSRGRRMQQRRHEIRRRAALRRDGVGMGQRRDLAADGPDQPQVHALGELRLPGGSELRALELRGPARPLTDRSGRAGAGRGPQNTGPRAPSNGYPSHGHEDPHA